jgi:hypothetical protein
VGTLNAVTVGRDFSDLRGGLVAWHAGRDEVLGLLDEFSAESNP